MQQKGVLDFQITYILNTEKHNVDAALANNNSQTCLPFSQLVPLNFTFK
jgi:hypothetical protein